MEALKPIEPFLAVVFLTVIFPGLLILIGVMEN